MIFLIQGFFFQNHTSLRIIHRAEVEGGIGAGIMNAMWRTMFSGVIYPDSIKPSKLIGEMFDRYGESTLVNVKIGPEKMSFGKRYNHRNYNIRYKFERVGNIWVGGFSHERTGKGDAKCIITEIPDNFTLPPA